MITTILIGAFIGIVIVLIVGVLIRIALRDYRINANWEKMINKYFDNKAK